MEIDNEIYKRLKICGLLPDEVRYHNVGASDYSKHFIQPWSIWIDYALNPWDADIVKRVLRSKQGEDRKQDYQKIIHICEERIRQIDTVREFIYTDNEEDSQRADMVEGVRFFGGIENYKYIIK